MPAWTDLDDKCLLLTAIVYGFGQGGDKWGPIAARLPGKTAEACRQRFQKLKRELEAEIGMVSADGAAEPTTPSKRKKTAKPSTAKHAKKKAKVMEDDEEEEEYGTPMLKEEPLDDAEGGSV